MPVCPEIAHSTGQIREHFMYIYFRSKVAGLQEGREPLPRYNMCRTHMPERRLIKHQITTRCYNNTEIRIRRRDIEVTSWCLETKFRFTGEEGEDTIELIALFK